MLLNTDLKVVDKYKVPTKKGSYSNIILECDMNALKLFVEKGHVICGLDKKSVYEVVDIIQCFNCQQFGHISSSCRNKVRCKFCSGEHSSLGCETKDASTCINCKKANENGAKRNHNHRASDGRCPAKSKRIEALKLYASKN